jgi:heat shock protein HslJ
MTSLFRRLVHCLSVLAVTACARQPAQPAQPAPKLDDRVFLSPRVTEDGEPRALVEGTRLELGFIEEGHRIGARAGCNSLVGSTYTIESGRLVVTGGGTTRIGCAPELLAQDQWYFGFLQSRPSITVAGDTLVLDGGGTRIEYLDQGIATPDVSLTGRTWTVQTIIDGTAATTTQWPEPARIVFGSNGTVMVDTGCNSGSGTYEVSGDELTFAGVAVTERFCDGDTGRLEKAVLGVVHGPQPVTWEITVDRLVLRGENVGLELVAEG